MNLGTAIHTRKKKSAPWGLTTSPSPLPAKECRQGAVGSSSNKRQLSTNRCAALSQATRAARTVASSTGPLATATSAVIDKAAESFGTILGPCPPTGANRTQHHVKQKNQTSTK